jgi:hypothetical protein
MNPRSRFNLIRHVATAALALAFAGSATAAEYYVVVPVKGRTAATALSVELNGYALPQGQVGMPYAGFNLKSLLTVTGDPGYTGYGVKWSVASGSLPPGLTLNSDGSVSGTPTAGGASSFEVMASYKTKAGQQGYQILVLNIAVALAAGTPQQALVGQAYSYNLNPQLTVRGDPAYNGSGVTWSVVSSTLPTGLYLTSDGWIGGTPTAGGTGAITARATYRGVTGQQTYQVVTLNIAVALAEAAPPQAQVGVAYSYSLSALLSVSGDPAYNGSGVTWSVVTGALPAGLSLGADGTISGTPTAAGDGPVTVQAAYRGANGQQTYEVVSLAIAVSLAQATLPYAPVGSSYTYDFSPQLSVTGDPGYDVTKVTWSPVGALPTGLSLSNTGVLSGTPTQLGDEGGVFSLAAAYRTKSGQQSYTLYPSDPLYGSVALLMHMDSGFGDAKGHAFSTVGNPAISTSSSKYGGGSAWFNGSSYLKTSYSPSFAFSGDFTVELWANISSHTNFAGLIAAAQSTSWTGWQIIFDGTTNNVRFEGGAPNIAMVSGTPLPLNTWAHIALVRQGMAANNVRLYINGALTASTTFTGTLDNGGQPLYIGVERTAGTFITGYIDDVRITRAARYTGPFTPPPASLPTR